jgi:hypothetical protein
LQIVQPVNSIRANISLILIGEENKLPELGHNVDADSFGICDCVALDAGTERIDLGDLEVSGLTDEVGESEAVHVIGLLRFNQALDLVDNLGADHFRVLLEGQRVKYFS